MPDTSNRILDRTPVGHFAIDPQGVMTEVNHIGAELIGKPELTLIGQSFEDLVASDDRPLFRRTLTQAFAERAQIASCELSLLSEGSDPRFVRVQALVHPSDGDLCRAVVIDLTDRRNTEKELEIIGSVYHTVDEAILVADRENRILTVNSAFTRVTGYPPEDVIGRSPDLLLASGPGEERRGGASRVPDAADHWQGEVRHRRKDGVEYVAWVSIHCVRDDDDRVVRRISVIRDVTRQKEVEEAIWKRANYDFVTGLPNRHLFQDRLRQGIRKAQRNGLSLALLFIDLDQFKDVNDTYGHQIGDALLLEAAIRIRSCVRNTDTTARVGGDEFAVIMADLDDTGRVESAVREILHQLSEAFRIDGHEIRISASIGVGVFPTDAREPGELLRFADRAMYGAKSKGGGDYRRHAIDVSP
jgi:diguanylate cyclase (GGDEF)-like protein/PAS domain S-box-containing protein